MPIQVSRRRLHQTVAVICIGGGLVHLTVAVAMSFYRSQNNLVGNIVTSILLICLGSFFAYRSSRMPDQTITLCQSGAEQIV
jgi:hypothetical protein